MRKSGVMRMIYFKDGRHSFLASHTCLQWAVVSGALSYELKGKNQISRS